MKKIFLVLMVVIMMISMISCNQEESKTLILATTTSTENSGLLAAILPDFEETSGISVDVVAVGTGAALQKGRDGEADVLLVHALASEKEFVAEGHGRERFDVMYNDFVIVGPASDPAELNVFSRNVVKAYQQLATSGQSFISRGDDSGTHKKELSLWVEAELVPQGDWYLEVGKGMGDTLVMADELEAYTMTDRATYLSMQDNLALEIIVEGDALLFNQYGVIPVNPEKSELINNDAAETFITWLLSDTTQEAIGEFGVEEFGQPLFVPNAE